MTPPSAATVAGRSGTGRRTGRRTGMRPAGSSRVAARPAHRSPARPPTRPARRVSGPARPAAANGAAAAAAAATAVALPVTAPRPSAPPRRRPVALPRPVRRGDLPLGARGVAWLRALPDHRLLERLIGGRIWIVLIGTLLVGIVTMQLTLLRLNAGIGQAIERSTALVQSNAELRASNSRLSDSERIVALATRMGFVTPPQGSPRFLTAREGDARTALTTMRVPQPPLAGTTTASDTATTADATTTTVDPATTGVPATSDATTGAATTGAATTGAATTGASTTGDASTPAAGAPLDQTTAGDPAASATAGGAAPPGGGQG